MVTDGQMDRPSTVTLAVHARRGLIVNHIREFVLHVPGCYNCGLLVKPRYNEKH